MLFSVRAGKDVSCTRWFRWIDCNLIGNQSASNKSDQADQVHMSRKLKRVHCTRPKEKVFLEEVRGDSYQVMARRANRSAFVVVDDVFANIALVALVATASTGALFVTATHFRWTPNFFSNHAACPAAALTALIAYFLTLVIVPTKSSSITTSWTTIRAFRTFTGFFITLKTE